MINPATGWFKIKQYDDKKSITVAIIVKQEWLARYPRPYLITLDQGSELLVRIVVMCINDYSINRKLISMHNPQANAIVQCMHQMLRNLMWSFELQDNPYIDMDDPWSGILVAASFLMCSTYHTTLCNAWPACMWEGYDT